MITIPHFSRPTSQPRRPARRCWAAFQPLLLLAAACLSSLPGRAAAPFEAIVAFGDSLTDTWREPAADPVLHYEGRWSNGPLWIEYLSTRLGFPYEPTLNFAHSGAQCDDTYQQVTNAVLTTPPDRTLYVVWAGGNDFLQEYDTLLLNNTLWTAHINKSINSLSNATVSLLARDARHILVPNTVDISVLPSVSAYLLAYPTTTADALRAYLRSKVQEFNSRLASTLAALRTTYPDRHIHSFDSYTEFNRILQQAAQYGFTEIRLDALTDTSLLDKSFNGPGDRYVFWDPIHPGTRAHSLVADWFEAAVAPRAPTLTLSSGASNLTLTLLNVHSGKSYQFLASTNLQDWTPISSLTALPELSPTLQLPLPSTAAPTFYRASWSQ